LTRTITEELDDIRTRLDKLYTRISSLDEARSIKGAFVDDIDPAIEGMSEEKAADLIRPLAHAERVRILKKLRENGKYFTELMDKTGLSQSPLTFHLSMLEKAGYVDQEFARGRYLITTLGTEALRLIVHLYNFGEGRR